ncbi:MAG TPA: META domain-containing protein, partial [Cytophaga sp.]|nr:META domain-containing protein [Cytophaga sp.]
LYPNVKPTISFDARPKQVSGTTSCNTYTGSYSLDGKNISFGNGFATTKMACEGNGETVFVQRLAKANKFFIKDQTTLMLLDGDIALLEFKKTMGPKSY